MRGVVLADGSKANLEGVVSCGNLQFEAVTEAEPLSGGKSCAERGTVFQAVLAMNDNLLVVEDHNADHRPIDGLEQLVFIIEISFLALLKDPAWFAAGIAEGDTGTACRSFRDLGHLAYIEEG